MKIISYQDHGQVSNNRKFTYKIVGVALSIGMVDEVPMSETDVPIDDVIYP